MDNQVTRRQFLATTTTAAAVAAAASTRAHAQPEPAPKPKVCIFSKHLQFMNYTELAKACTDLGMDGVDLPVRTGGHVLPENVERDLPRAVEAVRSEGHDVYMISTRFPVADMAYARPILKTASELGIKYFRIGGQKYSGKACPSKELKRFTEEVRTLVPLAEEYDMVAAYHIHSGPRYVGAPVWDLHRMMQTIGSDRIRVNWDLGHTVVEGSIGVWEINAWLVSCCVPTMAAKDFIWKDKEFQWVPVGEGHVPFTEQFKIFRNAGFAGPISLHFEYDIESNDVLLEDIRKAGETIRAKMKEGGYA